MIPMPETAPGIAGNIARDRLFALAMLAAPVVWLALWALNALPAALALPLLLRFVLVQPVVEELVFRGMLQGWLRTKLHWQWHGITAANLVTSVAFAAAHLLYQPPSWALAVFIPSIVFGYFRDRHESTLPSVLLHAWYNAGFFVLPLTI